MGAANQRRKERNVGIDFAFADGPDTEPVSFDWPEDIARPSWSYSGWVRFCTTVGVAENLGLAAIDRCGVDGRMTPDECAATAPALWAAIGPHLCPYDIVNGFGLCVVMKHCADRGVYLVFC